MNSEVTKLARLIDHAILHPTHTEAETIAACELGRRFQVGAVCIKPCFTSAASRVLKGSEVAVCAVTGFPHGNSSVKVKVFETEQAIADGATEIDVVVNNGLVAAQDWAAVLAEIKAVNKACIDNGALLKVIFENDYLNADKIKRLCEICTEAGAAYVKTSTGFGYVKQPNGDFNYKGATREHIELMKASVGPNVKIKAAAGIRTLDDLLLFRDLGCSRIGAAATEAILTEATKRFGGEVPAATASTAASSGY